MPNDKYFSLDQGIRGFSAGSENIRNAGALEYGLDFVLFPICSRDRFPGIPGKIAALTHAIVTRHIFHDANKRTALAVMLPLSELNTCEFRPTEDDEDFMVRIAAESLDEEKVAEWVGTRLKPRFAFS